MNQQPDTNIIVTRSKSGETVCTEGIILIKIDGKLIPVQATANFPIPFQPSLTNG